MDTPVTRHATRRRRHYVFQATAWTLAAVAGFGLVFAQTYKTKIESEFVTQDITKLLGPDRPAAPQNPVDGASGADVNILLMGADAGEDREGARNEAGPTGSTSRSPTVPRTTPTPTEPRAPSRPSSPSPTSSSTTGWWWISPGLKT